MGSVFVRSNDLGPPTTADRLVMFTIYDHPLDHPNSFVVRRWDIVGGQSVPGRMALAATLDEARRLIPPGTFNLGRESGDDHRIVETWI